VTGPAIGEGSGDPKHGRRPRPPGWRTGSASGGDAEASAIGGRKLRTRPVRVSSDVPRQGARGSRGRRVLRSGGRVAIADVVRSHERLARGLRGPLAKVSCVGTALSREDLTAVSRGRIPRARNHNPLHPRSWNRWQSASTIAARRPAFGSDQIIGPALSIEERNREDGCSGAQSDRGRGATRRRDFARHG